MTKIGYGANATRRPENRIVEWGKYKGVRIGEVPTSYLEWFIKNAYPQMLARREWAREELDRRREKILAMRDKRATIVLQRRGKKDD